MPHHEADTISSWSHEQLREQLTGVGDWYPACPSTPLGYPVIVSATTRSRLDRLWRIYCIHHRDRPYLRPVRPSLTMHIKRNILATYWQEELVGGKAEPFGLHELFGYASRADLEAPAPTIPGLATPQSTSQLSSTSTPAVNAKESQPQATHPSVDRAPAQKRAIGTGHSVRPSISKELGSKGQCTQPPAPAATDENAPSIVQDALHLQSEAESVRHRSIPRPRPSLEGKDRSSPAQNHLTPPPAPAVVNETVCNVLKASSEERQLKRSMLYNLMGCKPPPLNHDSSKSLRAPPRQAKSVTRAER